MVVVAVAVVFFFLAFAFYTSSVQGSAAHRLLSYIGTTTVNRGCFLNGYTYSISI